MEHLEMYYVGPRGRKARRSSLMAHPLALKLREDDLPTYQNEISDDLGCDPSDVTVTLTIGGHAVSYYGPWTYYRRAAMIRAGVKGIRSNSHLLDPKPAQ